VPCNLCVCVRACECASVVLAGRSLATCTGGCGSKYWSESVCVLSWLVEVWLHVRVAAGQSIGVRVCV
jgi:hypothetical protein